MNRIEKLAQLHPTGIILREKDLTEEEYEKLAKDVMKICEEHGACCILHSFIGVAQRLKCPAIHLPLHILRTVSEEEKKQFEIIGVSCHSVEDATEAEKLGATYITAGHIFETDCKKGLPGRGLEFLKNVCESVSVPVFAIGGISVENINDIRNTKAKGACVMSGTMICDDVGKYLKSFENVK